LPPFPSLLLPPYSYDLGDSGYTPTKDYEPVDHDRKAGRWRSAVTM